MKIHHFAFLIVLSMPHIFMAIIKEQEIYQIGMLIWQNEASKRTDLLVFWSEHEPFPSLGIGHCIWYPQGYKGKYGQMFPALCDYLEKHGVQLPGWLKKAKRTGAPWKTREEFLQDTNRTQELRQLLSATIPLQIQFMIEQLEKQFPSIVQHAPKEERKKVRTTFKLMRTTPLGTYALVDYLNFKGSGINAQEESNGHRWGLLQVLLGMPHELTQDTVAQAFSVSAAKTLLKLIENSAPHYSRVKYLNGWIRRVSTYANGNLFNELAKEKKA
jgi:hypothetical protein